MPSSRFSLDQPSRSAHRQPSRAGKPPRSSAPRRRKAPEAVFTEAHWRALSDELQLAFFCDHADCRRHQLCRGAGDERRDYFCWEAMTRWTQERRDAPEKEEESVDDVVEDYRERVLHILKGLNASSAQETSAQETSSQDAFERAPRDEPAAIANIARIAEDDAPARSGPSLRAL